MNRLSTLLPSCLVVLSLLVLPACDSGGSSSEDEINHEFSLSITPTSSSANTAVPKVTEKELNGYSFFVDTEDIEQAEEQAFVIYMSGNESLSQENATQGLFGFLARRSTQPGTGEFTITDGSNGEPTTSEFVGWLYEDLTNTQSAPYYFLRSGTLNLSTSNDNEVSGTIRGTATAFTFTETGVTEETVEVSGSFTAKNLDTYVPFGEYANSPS